MGKSNERELKSRLSVLILHMLKWRYQKNMRSNSWKKTIEVQRERALKNLKKHPGLKNKLYEILPHAYKIAVKEAEKETGLKNFPSKCPFSLNQILDQGRSIEK